jgi:hypothetical protein
MSPAYSNNPLTKVKLALPGYATYFWGSLSDTISPTKMTISQVALASNVATLTVQVIEGNVPVAGQLVTVTGTQTSSGEFNVTAVAIASVSINATTGAGTITYALTGSNVSATADSGLAVAPQAPTYEAPGTLPQNSQAIALPMAQDGKSISGHSVEVLWASGTSAGTVNVQYTDDNSNGGDWQTVSSIVYPNTRYDPAGLSAQFVRLNIPSGGLTGATTIAARLLAR